MTMDYATAAQKYLELRHTAEAINEEAKKKVAAIKASMADLETWFALKAKEEGLETIPTSFGTAYWSTHSTASVAAPDVFKEFVISTQSFDLIETRASKTAVKSFITAHGAPPPGVNFSTVRVFNLREASSKL
jgi:hypothetical protein